MNVESHGPGSPGGPGRIPEAGISPFWLAAVILRGRSRVAAITAVGMAISLAIAFLRPAAYTTSFSFLPQATDDQNVAGLASLAGQFGISLGAAGGSQQSPQFYADLLSTRRVLVPIAVDSFAVGDDPGTKVALSTFLRIAPGAPPVVIERTLRELREKVISTSVPSRATGVVTVNVRTKSPQLSLAIAERLLTGLHDFNLVIRKSQASEERVFTEKRLADARVALRAAEDELQRFLQSNRRLDFPTLAFERERLEREMTLREEVVRSLAQRYEEARIREVRDTPVLNVIEQPRLAAQPDERHRAVIFLVGSAGAFFLGLLVVFVHATWVGEGSVGSDPALAQLRSEWQRIRGRRAA